MDATTRRFVTTVAASSILAVACTQEPTAPTSPTSAVVTGSGAPTGGVSAGGTGATGGPLPTTSPAQATGNLSAGEFSFRVSGDVEADGTLRTVITAVYPPPPGALAIVWAAGGTDATVAGLGGTTFRGTRRTSPTLSLTLTVQTSGGIASFLSLDGGCGVSIDVARLREVSGRIACSSLESSTGEVVDVSAAFEAAG